MKCTAIQSTPCLFFFPYFYPSLLHSFSIPLVLLTKGESCRDQLFRYWKVLEDARTALTEGIFLTSLLPPRVDPVHLPELRERLLGRTATLLSVNIQQVSVLSSFL